MGKVIQFPNSALKELREQREKYSKENNASSSNSKIKEDDEYTVGIPVRFSNDSRYDEYYLITNISRIAPRYDVSEYIKVSKNEPLNTEKWSYYEKGKGMSDFEFNNAVSLSMKFRYFHVAYKDFLNSILEKRDLEVFLEKLHPAVKLPLVLQIKLNSGYNLNMYWDKPNEFDLMMIYKGVRHISIKNTRPVHFFPNMTVDRPVVIGFDGKTDKYVFLEGVLIEKPNSVDVKRDNFIFDDYVFRIMEEESALLNKQVDEFIKREEIGISDTSFVSRAVSSFKNKFSNERINV